MLLQLLHREANVRTSARLTALTISIKKKKFGLNFGKELAGYWELKGNFRSSETLSVTGWELEYFSCKLQAVCSLSGSQLCFNYVQSDQHARCNIARAEQGTLSMLCWCNMMSGEQVVTLAPKSGGKEKTAAGDTSVEIWGRKDMNCCALRFSVCLQQVWCFCCPLPAHFFG